MTRDEQRDLLLHGDIEVLGRVDGSSNQALLISVTLDGVEGQACYKAEVGERPLWDFPDGLWRREVAAYELDCSLNTDLVPTTVAREDAPFGIGSLQWWVDDNLEDHYFTLRDREDFRPWFTALAAFDVVANNADRKSGHIIFDNERCWAIDNGLCFNEIEKLRTVVWEFSDERLSDELCEQLERFASGDGGELAHYLTPSEIALTQHRAKVLVDTRRYPAPSEDGDWPPYPWPLV